MREQAMRQIPEKEKLPVILTLIEKEKSQEQYKRTEMEEWL